MKLKSTKLALAVAMALGSSVPAVQAVELAQDGLGDTLIFPYYTVRNGYDTNIAFTNTSAYTVAVKIRFREAHNSRDVRDFNIVLSPYDIWNGTVTSTPDGLNAMIVTRDKTCTAPNLPDLGDGTGRKGIAFTNIGYTGVNEDASGLTSLDRTREGHIEVISMGHSVFDVNTAGSVAYNAKHIAGVPRNCAAVQNAFNPGALGDDITPGTTRFEFDEPLNVLKGTSTLLNVENGRGGSQEAVILTNFFSPNGIDDLAPPAGFGTIADLIFEPQDVQPNLAQANPPRSVVNDSDIVGGVFVDDWAVAVDAVSALLARTNVINRFSVNPDTGAGTDWVVTFPTKYAYVDNVIPPRAPFTETFQAGDNGQSCDVVRFLVWDREENQDTPQTEQPFSPPQPGAPPSSICKETNVLSFAGSNVFGSSVSAGVNTPFNSGWMNLDLDVTGDYDRNGDTIVDPDALISLGLRVYRGLPVVGFAFTKLENGVADANLLNYAFRWNHSYTRDIS